MGEPEAPGHDSTAEQAVLGAMLLDPGVIAPVRAILSPASYYQIRHQAIHTAITTLHEQGIRPDPLVVLRQLQTTGAFRAGYLDAPYLHTLVAAVPTTANATHYAHAVAEDARKRALTVAAQRLVQAADNPAELAAVRADLDQLDRPTTAKTGRQLRATRASRIGMQATDWLWQTTDEHGHGRHNWIPLVGLSLLGGREGIGKSTWAYRIAAQVTTGTLPGDLHGQPRSVVIAATEDDWLVTIVPRLVAAGADLDRVWRVDIQEDDLVEGLSLPRDIGELRDLCLTEDVALIVLDPLLGTISNALDTHKDAEVRRALNPLAQLASDIRGAIVGLIHANKSQGVDLLTRLMASRAFAAVARAVLYAAKEPVDDDQAPDERETFLFGQVKSNLGAKVALSFRYHPEGIKVGHDDGRGKDIWSSRIVVDAMVPGYLEELVAEHVRPKDTAEVKASRWLRGFLAAGPVESSKVKHAAGEAGHSERTIQRARVSMNVVVSWISGTRLTEWSLPPVPGGIHGTGGIDGISGTVAHVDKDGQDGTERLSDLPRVPYANVPRPPAPAPARASARTEDAPEDPIFAERSCFICFRPTTAPTGICERHEPPDENIDADEPEREWYP